MNNEPLSFDPARADEYELSVRVGSPTAPDGLTRVTLEGTGRFVAEQIFERRLQEKVTQERPTEEGDAQERDRRVTGELPRSEAEHLLRMATLFPWERSFPSRPGIPDEAIVVWSFGERGVQRATLRVWLREAESDPALSPVLEALRHNLAQLSHGEIYL